MFRRKKNFDYFDGFIQFSDYAIEASTYLHDIIINFDVSKLNEQLDKMHEIENNCDILHRNSNSELLGEFLPTIAAEDILLLNSLLDDIVDSLEEILIGMYTFNVTNIRPQAIIFSDTIVKLASSLKEATVEFKNFKKSKNIMKKLKAVKKLELAADEIYIEEMHRLHSEEDNIKKLVSWSRIYDLFEECADTFEEAIKQMESIILKYK